MDYEIIKFINEDISIDVKVDRARNTVWLTTEEIAILYSRTRSAIIKLIGRIFASDTLIKERVCSKMSHTGSDGKTYEVIHYNLEAIVVIGTRIKSPITQLFYSWCIEVLANNNNLDNDKKYEIEPYIFKIENGEISLDVRISPEEETVWLNQNQIAILFETSQPNISMHINNIFIESELEKNSVHKDFLYTASDGKQYNISFYNLDLILAVGYRVKSKRAVEFRKWATSVLKEYIIKGYAINESLYILSIERRFFKYELRNS